MWDYSQWLVVLITILCPAFSTAQPSLTTLKCTYDYKHMFNPWEKLRHREKVKTGWCQLRGLEFALIKFRAQPPALFYKHWCSDKDETSVKGVWLIIVALFNRQSSWAESNCSWILAHLCDSWRSRGKSRALPCFIPSYLNGYTKAWDSVPSNWGVLGLFL